MRFLEVTFYELYPISLPGVCIEIHTLDIETLCSANDSNGD